MKERALCKLEGLSLVLLVLAFVSPAWADSASNHRVRNQHLGVSGGNVNNVSARYCCSGTLGSLVQDGGGTRYILSNNHVLANSDRAKAGEDVSQPGLIDNNCRPASIVADFTAAPKLGSNVDAAIAQLRPGMMDSTGFIEDIGTISSIVASPAVALSVAKSGRTTGLTLGSISSINSTVNVKYPKSCGSRAGTVITYTNQVVITPGAFSAGGDSGSLVVVNDGCHQPVGLLFAGSSTVTIANPVSEVLGKVSATLGTPLSFTGGTCATVAAAATAPSSTVGAAPSGGAGLSRAALEAATAVLQREERNLMARPSVTGVGVGASASDPSRAAIIIYVDSTSPVTTGLPTALGGVPVRVIQTDPIVAY